MKYFAVVFLTLTLSTAYSQSKIANIEAAYTKLANDPQAKYAQLSLCVLDAKTGKIIFAKNENTGLAPASTLKTITAATAYSMLGKDFQYETILAYTGKITPDGVLNGDLIIVGSGDPTLGSWRYERSKEKHILNQWVTDIKNAGIKEINGRVIGDDSLFPTQSIPEGWIWQDIGNYYGAGPSALNWRENQFDIKLRAGSIIGSPVTGLRTIPEMPYLVIANELQTGSKGSGDNAYAFLAPYTNIAYLRGTWGIGITKEGISASIPDPAFETAYRLLDTLKKIGLSKNIPVTTSRRLKLEDSGSATNYTILSTTKSPDLTALIYWFNRKSINLYGEALIKTMALKAGKPATTAFGVATMIDFWKERGIDSHALNIFDGSGLSPATRVTTLAMASILFQAQKEAWFGAFFESLPLYNGMKIKSGSIKDVAAYAGYHTDSAGNKYVVVININNYNGSGISGKLFSVLNALK